MSLLNESKRFDDFTDLEKNQIFDIFTQSYIKATGASWDRYKFYSRANDWLFFGDPTGFVTVRPQQSGYYKLTGIAGNMKSILKGLQELNATNYPIWGMMTPELGNILTKRYGYRVPNRIEAMVIGKLISNNVFGNVEHTRNPDGSITFKYADVGEATKIFVGNDAYYKKARRDAFNAGLKKIGLKEDEEVLTERRAVEHYYEDSYKMLLKYLSQFGYDNTYVSFRQTVNTGFINRSNSYDTPTGFYIYPLKNFKDKILNNRTRNIQEFMKLFPYAPDSTQLFIFTLTNASRILFSTNTTTAQTYPYVKKIQELYGQKQSVKELCELYYNTGSASNAEYETDTNGNYKYDDNGSKIRKYNTTGASGDTANQPTFRSRVSSSDSYTSEFQKFWLFIYEIAYEFKNTKGEYDPDAYFAKYPHTFTKICYDLGIDGFVDDACAGVIHSNEPCQGVLFKGFRNNTDNFKIIPIYQRYDTAPRIDKPRDDDSDSGSRNPQEYKRKYEEFLTKKLRMGTVHIMSIDYQTRIKERKAFLINAAQIPFFVNRDGELNVSGVDPSEILPVNANDVNDYSPNERTAYINSAYNTKYQKVYPYGEYGEDRAIAIKGNEYVFIDTAGKADISNVDFNRITSAPFRAAFFNQRANKNLYQDATPYPRYGEGVYLATNHDGDKLFINANGEPDITNIKYANIDHSSTRAIYMNQLLGQNIFKSVRDFGEFGGDVAAAMRNNTKSPYTVYTFINKEGQIDISGVDVRKLEDNNLRVSYMNQKLGEDIYENVGSFNTYGLGISLAYEIGKKPVFINTEGQPDISTIDTESINDVDNDTPRTAYFNQKLGSNYGYVGKFGQYGDDVAMVKDRYGKISFINSKGQPDISKADITKITDSSVRAAYVNSILGTDYRYVTPFDQFGDNIAYAIDKDNKGTFINKDGKPDIRTVNPSKIDDSTILTSYFNQKFGTNFYKVEKFGRYGDNATLAYDSDHKPIFININGQPDISNVDIKKIDSSDIRAVYINQRFGRKYQKVFPYGAYGKNVALANDAKGHKVFINNRGNKSTAGIDFEVLNSSTTDSDVLALYFNQKHKTNFQKVYPFNGKYGENHALAVMADGGNIFINKAGQSELPPDINFNGLSQTGLAAYFNQRTGAQFSEIIRSDAKASKQYFFGEVPSKVYGAGYIVFDIDGNLGVDDENDLQIMTSHYGTSTINDIIKATKRYSEEKNKPKPEITEKKLILQPIINEEVSKFIKNNLKI